LVKQICISNLYICTIWFERKRQVKGWKKNKLSTLRQIALIAGALVMFKDNGRSQKKKNKFSRKRIRKIQRFIIVQSEKENEKRKINAKLN